MEICYCVKESVGVQQQQEVHFHLQLIHSFTFWRWEFLSDIVFFSVRKLSVGMIKTCHSRGGWSGELYKTLNGVCSRMWLC